VCRKNRLTSLSILPEKRCRCTAKPRLQNTGSHPYARPPRKRPASLI
jgi:hypothetical protein